MLHNKGELDVYSLTQKIWSSNTAKSNASKMHFQIGGNLVLYYKNGTPIWATDTKQILFFDPVADKLLLKNDGNLYPPSVVFP